VKKHLGALLADGHTGLAIYSMGYADYLRRDAGRVVKSKAHPG
jgi:hypothetical protein